MRTIFLLKVMRFFYLILGILSVWRITHLLYAEDGPWNIVTILRRRAGEGFGGKLLDCFYCLSFWIALPFAFLIGETGSEQFLLWPALSAGAILLERITNREQSVPPVQYFTDEENNHAMLRKTETTVPQNKPDSPDS